MVANEKTNKDVKEDNQDGITITVPIPPNNPKMFRFEATEKVLLILSDNPYTDYTIRELARVTGYSHPAIKNAVDILSENDIIVMEEKGNKKRVSINRSRLKKPDDPILQIPQEEFQEPVRCTVEKLKENLEEVKGILIFGSVARGAADRRSDIDLWVLVQSDRATNQRKANEIAKEYGKKKFKGNRYEFQILVESTKSAMHFDKKLNKVLSSSITLYETETLRRFKNEVNIDVQ